MGRGHAPRVRDFAGVRPPLKVDFAGLTFRVVGNRIYWGRRGETDHEFYLRVLQSIFGVSWYRAERLKVLEERHVVAQWYESYCRWQREQATNESRVAGGWIAIPSGEVWSLLTLAYDLYCVSHGASIPRSLKKRLKEACSFQGAKYEIAVAAIFVQQDYEIEWTRDRVNKACEFLARHGPSGEKIGVEAKSRHRSGVLLQPGRQRDSEEVKIGVSSLLREALKQQPAGVPFVIFIDLNLPATDSSPLDTAWWKDIEQAIDTRGDINENHPEGFTALFVTNFSYHYAGSQLINTGAYASNMAAVIPRFPIVQFQHLGNLAALKEAVGEYGNVPTSQDVSRPKRIAERLFLIQRLAQFFHRTTVASVNRAPTITVLLTCGNILQDGGLLDFRQVGHTIFSSASTGTVDVWVYVEGHWFPPGQVYVKTNILDEHGNKVSDPPLVPSTVGENGVFEMKLLLSGHIPFKAGRYEVVAHVKDGPLAMTELFMIA